MKKAVIIGAGPAGVTAAYELLKKSDEYQVLVLEESQEIGGISRTAVSYTHLRRDCTVSGRSDRARREAHPGTDPVSGRRV